MMDVQDEHNHMRAAFAAVSLPTVGLLCAGSLLSY